VRKWRGKPVGADMVRIMRLVTESRDSQWPQRRLLGDRG
jgi:hypothetical protein